MTDSNNVDGNVCVRSCVCILKHTDCHSTSKALSFKYPSVIVALSYLRFLNLPLRLVSLSGEPALNRFLVSNWNWHRAKSDMKSALGHTSLTYLLTKKL